VAARCGRRGRRASRRRRRARMTRSATQGQPSCCRAAANGAKRLLLHHAYHQGLWRVTQPCVCPLTALLSSFVAAAAAEWRRPRRPPGATRCDDVNRSDSSDRDYSTRDGRVAAAAASAVDGRSARRHAGALARTAGAGATRRCCRHTCCCCCCYGCCCCTDTCRYVPSSLGQFALLGSDQAL